MGPGFHQTRAALAQVLAVGATLVVLAGSALAATADAPQPPGRLAEAFAAVRRGDLADAAATFEGLRRDAPSQAGPYLGLAEVQVRRNDLSGAERILNDGLAAAAVTSGLHRALGRLYSIQNQPDRAVASFQNAINEWDNRTRSQLELADLLNQQMGQAARSLPYYDAVIAAEPGNALARYGKGLALARLGAAGPPPADAFTELEAARQLDPVSALPLFAIAQLRVREGDIAAALTALDEALRRKPDFVQAQVTKANLLQGAGRHADAIALYLNAVQQNPRAVEAWAGLAMAQQATGALADAEASYRRAMQVNPQEAIVLNNLAALLADQKRGLDEALANAQKAVEIAPAEAAFLDTLGWVHYQRGDLPSAATGFGRSIQQRPTAETLARLGKVQSDLGQKAEAAASFRRALELRPGYQPAEAGLRQKG